MAIVRNIGLLAYQGDGPTGTGDWDPPMTGGGGGIDYSSINDPQPSYQAVTDITTPIATSETVQQVPPPAPGTNVLPAGVIDSCPKLGNIYLLGGAIGAAVIAYSNKKYRVPAIVASGVMAYLWWKKKIDCVQNSNR